MQSTLHHSCTVLLSFANHTAAAVSIVALLAVGSALPAQIGANDAIIANTRGKSFTAGIKIVVQNMSSCKQVGGTSPTTSGSVDLNGIYNGGSAYDPIRGGVWYSNGESLSCVDPLTGKVLCHSSQLPVTPRTKLSPFSITVSGLAFDNKANTLYMADGINGDIYQIPLGTTADPTACAYSSSYAGVKANMPSFHWLGGLAIDQVNGLLFVGSNHMTNGTRHIYVTTLAKWSGKLKDVAGKMPLCPNGTTDALWIQGLAFDSARSILYVTDGTTTTGYQYDVTKHEITATLGCCKNVSSAAEDAYAGLALMPERAAPVTGGCAKSPCQTCPNMTLATVGDAALGNPHFALQLTGAPDGGSVFAALGIGACQTPGIGLGFCGPLTVSTSSIQVFGVPVQSGTGCTSTARLGLPVPAITGIAGIEVSAQFLMECKTPAGSGHALSRCLSFEVTRN